MHSPLRTSNLNLLESTLRNVCDFLLLFFFFFWMVNCDGSPSPRLPLCPLFPVQVLSICLRGSNVAATALLISEPPYKACAESAKPRELYQPFPFIYTDSHKHGKSTLSDVFFTSSRNIFIVERS